MKPGRICCCVPFCRRTAADDGRHAEIICGPHWKLTDPVYRDGLARIRRLRRRFREGRDNSLIALGERTERRIWERIKKSAIEMAAGIAG